MKGFGRQTSKMASNDPHPMVFVVCGIPYRWRQAGTSDLLSNKQSKAKEIGCHYCDRSQKIVTSILLADSLNHLLRLALIKQASMLQSTGVHEYMLYVTHTARNWGCPSANSQQGTEAFCPIPWEEWSPTTNYVSEHGSRSFRSSALRMRMQPLGSHFDCRLIRYWSRRPS